MVSERDRILGKHCQCFYKVLSAFIASGHKTSTPTNRSQVEVINVHPAFAHQRSTNRSGVALASVTTRGGDGNDAERSKYGRSTDENSEESGSKAVALSDQGPAFSADPA